MVTNPNELLAAPPKSEPANTSHEIAPLTIRRKQDRRGSLLFTAVYLIGWYLLLKPDAEVVMIVLGIAAAVQLGFWVLAKTGTINVSHTIGSTGVEVHGILKQKIPWSKLRLVGLYKPNWLPFQKKKTQAVILNFADWPDMAITVSALSPEDCTTFFRLLARYVPQRLLAPEVLYMQWQCLNGGEASVDGFTQIWSEEFDKRFELANHVALATGSVCGNGRYTIEMTLATRFSSTTYLISDRNAKPFVLKELVLPIEEGDQAKHKLLEQFDREAAILAGLHHEGIVRVVDHFVENGRSYLVMERAAGSSLREHVRLVGPFDEKNVLPIAKQLAEVLDYLHAQNLPVIHRDVTPDNIVYSADTGRVTLVDFGAANIYQSHGTGTLIGKQGYMPPEQYKGKARPASDIYAFGSTILYMLTGIDPPGMGKIPIEASNIHPLMQTFLQSCLEFDHENRPSSQELIDKLDSLSICLEAR